MTGSAAAVTIRLTASEMYTAGQIGLQRQVQNRCRGLRDKYGCDPAAGWGLHIEGACGELAVAKFFGIYWNGALGDLRADDVGALQVRTRSRHDYELILHPDDPDDRPFILVTGTAPEFVLRGWIMGGDGKRPEYWKDPARGRPAFFVPQARLLPVRLLRGCGVVN